MNLSGKPVKRVLTHFDINPEKELLVVCRCHPELFIIFV